MKIIYFAIILVIWHFPIVVFACANSEPDCGKPTSWYEGNNIELNINDDHSEYKSRWLTKRYSGNDLIIEKDEQYQGGSNKGTLGIISGRMMITKGLKLKSGYEIDAADGPGLMIQLMFRLLGEVAPEGPSKVSAPIDINHSEKDKGIKVATSAASAEFGVPWSVTGSLAPSQDSDIEFNLRFTAKNRADDYSITLAGTWTKDNTLGLLSGEKDIKDWQVYKIGPYTKKSKDTTIFDYGAQPLSKTFNNIAALRKYIDEQEKPSITK